MAARCLLSVSRCPQLLGAIGRGRNPSPLRYAASVSGEDVRLFDKILVANRGEIACRVLKTSRNLGIRTVAVYSHADKNAMHVAMADEAYCIGPAPSSESYLRQDKIMEVAKATGAQAIHPGYGFLSENKNFAEFCQREGVEFIGPPPFAIEKMGIKAVSKKIMSESSVPIVPGYFGSDQNDQLLRKEAEKLGFPVLIKADLGGGGKGMRIVDKVEDFQSALEACRGEASKSFGDDKVLVEKFVERPRHVEVQVFGDKHGNMLHLFERDCSVQRRHQKIIEEAPAPGIHPEVKEMLWEAAVRAAAAVGYVGAGTVEFIMDQDQNFYFMEMNTRLQVEHPVTEMITGTDLVEWQIRVAAGAPLPISQSDLSIRGHSFEARIYAENPEKGFIPSPGVLHHLRTPQPTSNVRIDTGVRQGDEVSSYYDPMIAKLVVWAEDRSAALKRLRSALHDYQVAGMNTNIDFLGRLAAHESFHAGDVHTGFIEQHQSELFPAAGAVSEGRMMEAALALLALEEWTAGQSGTYQHDPYSPFNSCSGHHLNSHSKRTVSLLSEGTGYDVTATYQDSGCYLLSLDSHDSSPPPPTLASGRLRGDRGGAGGLILEGFIGEERVKANVAVIGSTLHLFAEEGGFTVEIPKPAFVEMKEKAHTGGIRSPKYPTVVVKVHVKPGDEVVAGDKLMTVEGMKMETNILSGKEGTVKTVFYGVKDNVAAFSKVVEFEEEEEQS